MLELGLLASSENLPGVARLILVFVAAVKLTGEARIIYYWLLGYS